MLLPPAASAQHLKHLILGASAQISSDQPSSNHVDWIKHASIISYQLGSTQISSHQFKSAPIKSGQLRSAQIHLMSIHIISSLSPLPIHFQPHYLLSLSASHPLPSTLSRFSHFPSTSKHMLSSLFPLSIHFQQEQRGGLRVAFWDPPRMLPLAWSCLGRLRSCLTGSFRKRKLPIGGRAAPHFENHRFPLVKPYFISRIMIFAGA